MSGHRVQFADLSSTSERKASPKISSKISEFLVPPAVPQNQVRCLPSQYFWASEALSEHTNTVNTHMMSKKAVQAGSILGFDAQPKSLKFRREWGKPCHFLLKLVSRQKEMQYFQFQNVVLCNTICSLKRSSGTTCPTPGVSCVMSREILGNYVA